MGETGSDRKLALFLEAIREAAEESCRTVEEQTAQITRRQLQKAEKEVHDRHEVTYRSALSQVRRKADSEIAAYRAASRSRLTQLREAYERTVFSDAAARIEAFTRTAEYGALLERSAARLAALCPEGDGTAVLYLRPADDGFADRVQAAFRAVRPAGCTVRTDEGIRLGGLRLSCPAAQLTADDTLEERLERQRPAFRQTSGLTVV